MNARKSFLFVHRWLGLLSGLVVFIVSITGCIFCFQDEIQDALYKWRHVQPQQTYLPPSVIKQKGLYSYPQASAFYTYYYGKDRPAMLFASFPAGQDLKLIYLNPYTGKLLHEENYTANFFTVIKTIHLYLLLPPAIGKWVVGIAVIIFILLLITGIVLWWPKRKTDRRRSFTVKWNGRWRRVNFDLHNVLGFYAGSIALVLAVTGLAIAFEWVGKAIYTTANLGKVYNSEKVIPKSDSLLKSSVQQQPAIDRAFAVAQRLAPHSAMYLISEDASASGAIAVIAYPKSLRFDHNSYFYFDQYSGKLLKALLYAQKSTGLKLNEMNYDIHVGQIGGIWGKIVAFIASLICASLPVTGLLIWLGKRKKPKAKKLKHVIHRRETHRPAYRPRAGTLKGS